MPRPAKKAKTKGKAAAAEISNGSAGLQSATAVAEPPFEDPVSAAHPVELAETEKPEPRAPSEKAEKRRLVEKQPEPEPAPVDKDHIATSLNIAKLQAMSMS